MPLHVSILLLKHVAYADTLQHRSLGSPRLLQAMSHFTVDVGLASCNMKLRYDSNSDSNFVNTKLQCCCACLCEYISCSTDNDRYGVMQLMSSGTWYISSGSSAGDKERLATIKKDMANNTHSASVFLQGNSSQHFAQPVPDYSARGDFNNRSFFIYRGTIPVAEVQSCLPAVMLVFACYCLLVVGCKIACCMLTQKSPIQCQTVAAVMYPVLHK